MTRDADRIAPILAALGRYWLAYPDLRLGQIVSRATDSCGLGVPLFLVEDDVIAAYLADRAAPDAVRAPPILWAAAGRPDPRDAARAAYDAARAAARAAYNVARDASRDAKTAACYAYDDALATARTAATTYYAAADDAKAKGDLR